MQQIIDGMALLAWTWSLCYTQQHNITTHEHWEENLAATNSHPSDKTYSGPALHRPHLPHLVSPVPCSWVSDNLFSCLGPHLKHQMLRRLDITFIRWAFPKIRGFKHNCNYSPSLDDGINNGSARFNGIKKIDILKWYLQIVLNQETLNRKPSLTYSSTQQHL